MELDTLADILLTMLEYCRHVNLESLDAINNLDM